MEAFLANLGLILPVVGLDLLKPRPQVHVGVPTKSSLQQLSSPIEFEIRHRSGITALAREADGEFIVLRGSEARKDTNNSGRGYQALKQSLISQKVLVVADGGKSFIFDRDFAFSSPSAAAAVVLDRNANGRTEWKTTDGHWTYHQWQERHSPEAVG
jgi:hypothetical protein